MLESPFNATDQESTIWLIDCADDGGDDVLGPYLSPIPCLSEDDAFLVGVKRCVALVVSMARQP